MIHVSAIQQGGRVNSASDFLSRGQQVKVKVMSVAGSRIGLSLKDVDQRTGADLSPHLRVMSDSELELEQRKLAEKASSGANAMPLGGGTSHNSAPIRSAKRLTSPERWEIKQLISSGVLDPSEYPDLDEDFNAPLAKAEIEEELDVEVREDEPPFLAGQTKRSLNMSPVRIVKAPDGSLNRAALAGASLARERRELRQQETNEAADSETRDLSTPWLDPMAQQGDKIFAQDARGQLLSKPKKVEPGWREQTFNKATTFGKITDLSIGDQRKALPIYALREPLLEAIREVSPIILD
jgi:ATP-dependent RNA helicase DHX8/PRP22